jgi:hypothetical protein
MFNLVQYSFEDAHINTLVIAQRHPYSIIIVFSKRFVKSSFNTDPTMLIIAVIVFVSLSRANPVPSKISSSSLLSRAVPGDQLCDHGYEWDGRYCEAGNGPTTWFDRCVPDDEAPVYYLQGQCAEGEHCFEYSDRDNQDQIECVPVPTTPDQKDVVTTKRQVGKRKFSALATPQKERSVSVKLMQDMPGSSVTGHIMG